MPWPDERGPVLTGVAVRLEPLRETHLQAFVMPSSSLDAGRIRHSVYFSMTADEWPGVRRHLEALLKR
jgi:hypothetical protein